MSQVSSSHQTQHVSQQKSEDAFQGSELPPKTTVKEEHSPQESATTVPESEPLIPRRNPFSEPVPRPQKQPPVGLLCQLLVLLLPSKYRPDAPTPGEEGPNKYPILGRGKQGAVVAALFTTSSGKTERVAVKRFEFNKMNDDDFKNLRRELCMCRIISHPQIVEFKDSFHLPGEKITAYFLTMERMDYTLDQYFKHMAKYDGQPNERKREHPFIAAMLVQILKALEYLHSLGIMHRDIKPANIGVNQKDFVIKLFDFGVSRREDQYGANSTTNIGSPLYSSVEVLIGKGVYNFKADIWSVALLATEVLGTFITMPMASERTKREPRKAMLGRIVELRGMPADRYREGFQDFFEKYDVCDGKPLDKELPLTRLSPDLAKNDLSEKNYLSLVDKMLAVEPSKRPSSTECLEHPYLRGINGRYDQLYRMNQGQQIKSHRDQFMEDLKNNSFQLLARC